MDTIQKNSRKINRFGRFEEREESEPSEYYSSAVYRANAQPDVDLGDNPMLRSMYLPFSYNARISDLNMTPTIVKTVHIVKTIKIGSSDGLFVLNWYSRDNVMRHYLFDNVLKKYNFYQDIVPDQNIQDNYDLNRFVTGGVMLQSATISGSNFNVAGVLVATKVQRIPDLYNLAYDQISSYKISSNSTLGNVPISEGVVGISGIDGSQVLRPNKTENVYPIDYMTEVNLRGNVKGWNPLFTNLALKRLYVEGEEMFNTDSITPKEWTPENAWGRIEIKVRISLVTNVYSVTPLIFNVWYQGCDQNGNTVYENKPEMVYHNGITNFISTNEFTIYRNDRREIAAFTITLGPNYLTTAAIAVDSVGTNISFKYVDVYEEQSRGPATLIAYQSVGTGQEIAISGALNYEVVPDSNLIRQIGHEVKNDGHPDDLKILKVISSQSDFKSVFTLSDYKKFSQYVIQNRQYSRQVSSYHASGLMDIIKPVMRSLSPMIGRTLGGFISMPDFGEKFGTMIGDTMFAKRKSNDFKESVGEGTYRASKSTEEVKETDFIIKKYTASGKEEKMTLKGEEEGIKKIVQEEKKKVKLIYGREWSITLTDKGGESVTYLLRAKMNDCKDNIPVEWKASKAKQVKKNFPKHYTVEDERYFYEYFDDLGRKKICNDFVFTTNETGLLQLTPTHEVNKKVNVTFAIVGKRTNKKFIDYSHEEESKEQFEPEEKDQLNWEDLDEKEPKETREYKATSKDLPIEIIKEEIKVPQELKVTEEKIVVEPRGYKKRLSQVKIVSERKTFSKEQYIKPPDLPDFDVNRDKRIMEKQMMKGGGFNSSGMEWNMVFAPMIGGLKGKIAKLILTRKPLKCLASSRAGLGWYMTKYTELKFEGRSIYLCDNLSGNDMVNAVVSAVLSTYLEAGDWFITTYELDTVTGPSFGLAFISLFNFDPYGAILSGAINKETGELETVGDLEEKFSITDGRMFICVPDQKFILSTEKVPRCFPEEIAVTNMRKPSQNLPVLMFVTQIAHVQIINFMQLISAKAISREVSGVVRETVLKTKDMGLGLTPDEMYETVKKDQKPLEKYVSKEKIAQALKAYEENKGFTGVRAILNYRNAKNREGTGKKSGQFTSFQPKVKISTQQKSLRRKGVFKKQTKEQLLETKKQDAIIKEENKKKALELKEHKEKTGFKKKTPKEKDLPTDLPEN